MKTCTRCRRGLSRDNFYKNRSQEDGLDIYCKTCKKGIRKKEYERNKKKTPIPKNDFGISDRKLDIKLVKGKKYIVPKIRRSKNIISDFTGKLEMVTDDLIILRHKRGFCECFRKIDFLTGEYQIKEA